MPPHNIFSLTQDRLEVQNTQVPEDLPDLAYRLFLEVWQRWTRHWVKLTGFEHLSAYNLDHTFLLTIDELVIHTYQ